MNADSVFTVIDYTSFKSLRIDFHIVWNTKNTKKYVPILKTQQHFVKQLAVCCIKAALIVWGFFGNSGEAGQAATTWLTC